MSKAAEDIFPDPNSCTYRYLTKSQIDKGNERYPEKAKGYHCKEIMRGTYGEISKIREELEELEDAMQQNNKIMALVEISDIYGALVGLLEKHFSGIKMADVEKMALATIGAFKSGERK